jgi:hypothetical protein
VKEKVLFPVLHRRWKPSSRSENGKADRPSRLLAREAKVADATAGV